MSGRTFIIVTVLFFASSAFAQVVDPQNVLIRNVQVVEDGAVEGSTSVSILIKDNKLELISEDEIPIPDGAIAIDAEGGFLFGNLVLNEIPSFIILDEDPRLNFDVLLDTDTHAVFAVHDGELRKNNLLEVLDERENLAEELPEKKPRGWLAYSPPPMILPLSYQDGDKWNQWKSRYIDGIFIGAVALDRQRWLSQDDESIGQVGDLDSFDGGEIRALRFGVVGTINLDTPWVYIIAAATNAFDKGFETTAADDFTFFDWRVDIPLPRRTTLSIGKQKEPFSLERLTSMINLPMQERTSGSDALLPSRNVGVVLSGTALNQDVTWAGGLFNDSIDTGTSFNKSSSQAIGRVTWLPYYSDDESSVVQLGLGLRYDNATEPLHYFTEPEFNKAPDYVNTGPIDANSSMLYNLEANWRKGPYWLAYEYVRNDVDSPLTGNPTFSGYHFTASWVVSGEMRPFNKKNALFRPVPVARTVYQGGWGAWELSTRFSSIDLTDGTIDGGEMDIFSVGANWWLTPFFGASMNYRYIVLRQGGARGTSSGLMARILLVLE
jgi:phosphate-selective porin OprO/OprP